MHRITEIRARRNLGSSVACASALQQTSYVHNNCIVRFATAAAANEDDEGKDDYLLSNSDFAVLAQGQRSKSNTFLQSKQTMGKADISSYCNDNNK